MVMYQESDVKSFDIIQKIRNGLYGLSCFYAGILTQEENIENPSDIQLALAIQKEVFENITDENLKNYIENDIIQTDEIYNLASDIARKTLGLSCD